MPGLHKKPGGGEEWGGAEKGSSSDNVLIDAGGFYLRKYSNYTICPLHKPPVVSDIASSLKMLGKQFDIK